MKFSIRESAAVLLAAGVWAASPALQAQTPWPQKPVRLVVAFPPGTPGDVVLRGMSGPLGEALGQPMVIENRPGAGGNVGTASVLGGTLTPMPS